MKVGKKERKGGKGERDQIPPIGDDEKKRNSINTLIEKEKGEKCVWQYKSLKGELNFYLRNEKGGGALKKKRHTYLLSGRKGVVFTRQGGGWLKKINERSQRARITRCHYGFRENTKKREKSLKFR